MLVRQERLRFHGCSYLEGESEKVVADKLIILCVDRFAFAWGNPAGSASKPPPKAAVTSAGIFFPFPGWRVFPTNYIKEREKQQTQD